MFGAWRTWIFSGAWRLKLGGSGLRQSFAVLKAPIINRLESAQSSSRRSVFPSNPARDDIFVEAGRCHSDGFSAARRKRIDWRSIHADAR
jgi:hypothetical protein